MEGAVTRGIRIAQKKSTVVKANNAPDGVLQGQATATDRQTKHWTVRGIKFTISISFRSRSGKITLKLAVPGV